MVPCFATNEIITPKKFQLNGLWFGPKKAKQAVIFVHGLTGSIYTSLGLSLAREVCDKETVMLLFNNHGYGIVNKVYRESKRGSDRIIAGAAHERFVDCVDDIQGAIDFVRKQGAKNIFLAGHSTGCQKSIYWAYKKKGIGVKGIILFAPVSDYAVARERKNLKSMVHSAQTLVKKGKSHEMMKGEMYDAQRFLSLYTPDSPEEIFTYIQPTKRPRMLQSVRVPILALWAAKDEFNDRPVKDIISWFEKSLKKSDKIELIPNVEHNFKGGERRVAKIMKEFMK